MHNELIAADDVIGTEVFNGEGRKLGRIDNIMIDRVSGKALYAIMTSGGVLGIGGSHYPLPWAKLKYDDALGGYVVDVSMETLERAPSYDRYGRTDTVPNGAADIERFERNSPSAMD
jgi:sporulation protein YlmC with PRC-barrel domain